MCSPREVGPGSWDPGSSVLTGSQEGVGSDLHLHTGLLVSAAAAVAVRACFWVQDDSRGLAPISRAHLGGALTSVGTQSKKPLSLSTPKQWSLASPAGPDVFPVSLLASCGVLAPFRLSSLSQHQSSPWGLTCKAQASAPAPTYWLAQILCVEISPLCPPHPVALSSDTLKLPLPRQ